MVSKILDKDLITVIVPVHNAENYLGGCIDSILNQTYDNLEVILVDDASKDNSRSICEEYAKKDSRVQVVKNDTSGGSANARNRGIEIATGRWMTFIDSDDYIAPEMIETMHTQLIKEDASCCVCSFHYVDEEKNELPWYTPELGKYSTMTGLEAAKLFLTTYDIEGFSWNKLFDSRFFIQDGIRFDEEQSNFVDMYAVFQSLLKSDKVCFCNEKFYYYYQRQGSLVHSFSTRKLDNFARTLNKISDLASDNRLSKEADYYKSIRMVNELYDVCYHMAIDKRDLRTIKEKFLSKKSSDISICVLARNKKLKEIIKYLLVVLK